MMSNPMPCFKGVTVGCDPELFVADDKGKLVCAEGLLPGTKENPHKVDRGAVQVDGMAAEFNIDPVSSYEDWELNITTVLKQLKGMLPEGYRLIPKASVVFDEDVWEAAPDSAKELGCSPDYNGWTGEANPMPESLDNPRLRTASGHIHVGWTNGVNEHEEAHMDTCRDLVQQLDYYLGAWSVLKDKDKRRRELYGKAGALRYKPYGVEYRVLSNFWVSSPTYRRAVWNRLQVAMHDMSKKFWPGIVSTNLSMDLIKSINESNLSSNLVNEMYYPIVEA